MFVEARLSNTDIRERERERERITLINNDISKVKDNKSSLSHMEDFFIFFSDSTRQLGF